MNEEEVQIDLMELLHYVLRKWRSILIVMLIMAVAANLYSVKKSMSEVAAATNVEEEQDTEIEIEDAKAALTEEEIEQVELAYTMYSYNAEQYQESEDYLESSVVMQMNPNEISTGMLSYQVKKDMSEEELTDILSMYENALFDEDTCKAVTNIFGEEYADTSVRDLISIYDTVNGSGTLMLSDVKSGILNIQVLAGDRDQCEQIMTIVKNRMQAYTEQLQPVFGQFSVNMVSEQYYVSANSRISDLKSKAINAVNSAYSAMQDASSGLSEDQLKYYELLVKPVDEKINTADNVDNTEVAVVEAPKVQYVNIKFLLIGLLAGIFLTVCWHAMIYILTHTVKDIDEVKIITQQPIFGAVLKAEENDKRNVIDKWIDSLFAHGKKNENNQLLTDRICHEIAMLAEQKNMKHLLLVSSLNDGRTREMMNKVSEMLNGLGMASVCAESVQAENTQILKQLEDADGVVLVEQLMKSSRDDIRNEAELCNRYQVEVLGNIVTR